MLHFEPLLDCVALSTVKKLNFGSKITVFQHFKIRTELNIGATESIQTLNSSILCA